MWLFCNHLWLYKHDPRDFVGFSLVPLSCWKSVKSRDLAIITKYFSLSPNLVCVLYWLIGAFQCQRLCVDWAAFETYSNRSSGYFLVLPGQILMAFSVENVPFSLIFLSSNCVCGCETIALCMLMYLYNYKLKIWQGLAGSWWWPSKCVVVIEGAYPWQ